MPSTEELNRYVLAGIAIVTTATLIYGVVVIGNPYAWVDVAVLLVALYLFWRLVRAHERLADAME